MQRAALKHAVFAGLAGFGITGAAHAAIISITGTQGSAYSVSSTDLIEGLSPGTNTNPSAGKESSGGVGALTDGVFGGLGVTNNPGTAAYTIGDGTTLVYTLTGSALGYDIRNINTYTGWGDNGRVNQDYTVYYSTVAAPATFIPIASVAFHPASLGTPQATEVLLSSSTGVIATEVGEIEFVFANPVQNDYVGYHELDVLGSTSYPEPASMAVLGFAGVGLLARRRRA
jgi:hypothetical protein